MGIRRSRKRGRGANERDSAEAAFREFEIGLGRAVLSGDRDNLQALVMLGEALTRTGRHEEAVKVDRRIIRLRPDDPVGHYNLACSYANLNQADSAFEALERALDLGYRDIAYMLRDEDLRNLRSDPRFRRLVEKRWGRRRSRGR